MQKSICSNISNISKPFIHGISTSRNIRWGLCFFMENMPSFAEVHFESTSTFAQLAERSAANASMQCCSSSMMIALIIDLKIRFFSSIPPPVWQSAAVIWLLPRLNWPLDIRRMNISPLSVKRSNFGGNLLLMNKLLPLLLLLCGCNSRISTIDGSYEVFKALYGDSVFMKDHFPGQKTIRIFKNGYWMQASFGIQELPFAGCAGG